VSDNKQAVYVQYGQHASTTDWSSTPGSLKHLRPRNAPVWPIPLTHRDRSGYQTGNQERIKDIVGSKGPEVTDLELDAYGLDSSGAGDGTDASTLDTDAYEILSVAFGGTQDGTGDTSDASDAGSGTTVTMDAAAAFAAGDGMLIKGTTSGKYVAREAVSVSSADVTVDRALTTDVGAADTADEDEVVYAARSFYLAPLQHDVSHLYVRAEGADWRRDYYGCLFATLEIDATDPLALVYRVGGLQSTDWADDVSDENPSYSAPTRGSLINTYDSPLWLDSTLYMAHSVKAIVELAIAPRTGQGGANGRHGFAVVGRTARIEATLRSGGLTTPHEVSDTAATTFRGDSVVDLGVQFGRSPGAASYLRAPAAEVRLDPVDDNGMLGWQMVAHCTESGNHSNVPGALRYHVF